MAKGKKWGFLGSLLSDASLLFWRIITIVISALTLFIIVQSAWSIIRSKREINRLNRLQEQYQRQIDADSALLNRLQYDEYLEQYARERYNMQRPNEQVYKLEQSKNQSK
ncbi:MAG: septum formation initiator family protein [Alistipes sp.]|nr:septum formation initiator family protein [Alistipes sp.]